MKSEIFDELKESVKEGGKWLRKNPLAKEHPIICHACGKKSGYTSEEIMFLVVTTDLTCHHCGTVVIPANNIIC
jgi:hypothetical protein